MIKKILPLLATLGALYLFGTYFYFSRQPISKNSCPITMPDQLPFVLHDPADPQHQFTTINDASCLNATRVYAIVPIKTIADIRQALTTARAKNLPVSIAGVRHSMGGQAFFTDALVLDMTQFNRIIALDETAKTLTVESGATWHDIQLYLHKKNLAVKAMQSTDIFTVGGSISVNAHGMDHLAGSVGGTIKAFSLMLADGSIQTVSKTEQPELFKAVIGGYGLFGVILEVTFEVVDNVMYTRDTIFLDYQEFPDFFDQVIKDNSYSLFYGHLSTSPLSFFKDMIIYGYTTIASTEPIAPLGSTSLVGLRRFLLNLAKRRSYAQVFKWLAEKYIDPALEKRQNKNTLSRNEVMHDSVEYLENILLNETDILQEYFIPRRNFAACIEQIGALLRASNIPVLNASVRIVHKEDILLNYAPEDMFALVLYLNQRVNKRALLAMQTLTRELIDLVLNYEGTFFLPYQLYFTQEQLKQAYPNIDEFFALKRAYDPTLMFMNKFYAKYAA